MVTYNNGVVMLSYKEYKQLNESLYGAFNLGLRSPNTLGIVSASSVNGTEAAIEAEAEQAIEEAKKMKKKMDCDDSEDDEEMDDKDADDKDEDGDEDEDEEGDDEEGDEDEDEEEKEEPKMMMKKKAKKEWSEVFADLETVLEGIEDEESMSEIKKGMQIIKEGLKKGLKGHKKGCDCNFCKNIKNKEDSDKEDSHKENGHKKDCDCKMCQIMMKKCGSGKYMNKKCGSEMKKEDADWWNSVHSMINSNPDQKNWDGIWRPVGEVQQAVREGVDEGVMDTAGQMMGGAARAVASVPGKVAGAVGGAFQAADHAAGAAVHDFSQGFRKKFGMQHEADPKEVESYEKMIKNFDYLCSHSHGKTDQAEDYMDGFLNKWAREVKKTPAWPELLKQVVEVAKKYAKQYDYLGLLSQKAREHGVQLPA